MSRSANYVKNCCITVPLPILALYDAAATDC